MKSVSFTLFLVLMTARSLCQELFVFTEPASNMPARSLGIRAANWVMEQPGKAINYHLIPELMWGISQKWMLHAEGFFSNRNHTLAAEGAGLYVKYRFLSRDDVFRHFRMAAFGRMSTNNGDIHQEEIEINGHNTGYEGGLVATQLLHKLALSLSLSYEMAFDNRDNHVFPETFSNRALNYSFSAGRLMLPKTYETYRQVNVNVMLELLGQSHPDEKKQYLDVAPSIQFIVNSQTRIDLAFKHQLYSGMSRSAPNGILLRLEHVFFQVTQKSKNNPNNSQP